MLTTCLRLLALILIASPLIAQEYSWRSKTAPEVQWSIDHHEPTDILLVFEQQADLKAALSIKGKTAKATWVYQQLQTVAQASQQNALRILQDAHAGANSYTIANAIAVENADLALIEQLAALPEVARISPDPWVNLDLFPTEHAAPVSGRNTVEWGVERVKAPEVWAMGYTGQGITVGGADTGYDWEHPALKPHYRGYDSTNQSTNHNYNWFDGVPDASPLNADTLNPCGFNSPVPCDDGNHGTHTAGTMVGDDGMGNQIGVAPGAQWVGCRNMERSWGRPSTYLNCFEWFLAPTDVNGNHPDPAKAPHVINNSWYCNEVEGCTDLGVNELLRIAVANLKAAGVFVVISNGNFGPFCNTADYPPAYFEESFSVGAIQINDTISDFSSRGPVAIDSSFRVKPNIVAPGSAIRSSVPDSGYAHFWGTSMAGPHVVGVVALVLSAAPELAGEVDLLEDILEETAIPKYDGPDCMDNNGDDLPNNTYGYGLIDAAAAVMRARQLVSTSAPGTRLTARVSPNPATDFTTITIDNTSRYVTIQLYDIGGRLVFEKIVDTRQTQSTSIHLGHLDSGVYFYRLLDHEHQLNGVLIKKHP